MDAGKLFLHLLFLILRFILCTSIDTLAVNQSIVDGDLLISKGHRFALGFFSPGHSSRRYVGIWYHQVGEQTVVWVANRNNPIDSPTGRLSISQHCNLILYDEQDGKAPVWSTNGSVEGLDTCEAQLLDSGNLVLIQGTGNGILWQSFDSPTNTMLEGMKVGLDRKTGIHNFLTSWRSVDDPGIGEFSFKLNPSGLPQFFIYKGAKTHWRSYPWPWNRYTDVYKNSFIRSDDGIYFSYHLDDDSVLMRIVLDHTGLLKRLMWHESEGQWKEFGSALQYLCSTYGHCGAYGHCDPDNVNKDTFECACLPGYEPKFPRDWHLRDGSGGCVRKRLVSSSLCGHGEGFVKVAHVKLPDTDQAVWLDTNTSHIDCEEECRRNCSCSAYTIIDIAGKGSGCLTWYGELADTNNFDYGNDLHVRVDAIELAENARDSSGALHMKLKLAILVPSVASAWFIIIFALLWLRKWKRKVKNRWSKSFLDAVGSSNCHEILLATTELLESKGHPDLASYDLASILIATNNFSPENKIGQGGFGSVYKGWLSSGQVVAVKRLSKNSEQGLEEFKMEIMLIAKLQHRNLVKLLGCSFEKGEQILIYEYLPNKSLDSFLFDQTRKLLLDWRKRFDIIVGIARGILYLHQDSRLRIIHRDLKTSNILLDAELNPKISDFGTARIYEGDQIQYKTNRVAGTLCNGYMPPEYAVLGKYSAKYDVFSFGVILLEIISGKKNHGPFQDDSQTLIGHIWELWREGKALEAVDSCLKESCDPHEVLRCMQVGLLCVQENAMDRPTILAVILMLGSESALPSPKGPAFVFKKSCNGPNPDPPVGEDSSCSINEVTITEFVCRE